MPAKANETPKIIGLSVAIVGVLAFGFWRFRSLQTPEPNSANPNAPTSGAVTMQPGGNPNGMTPNSGATLENGGASSEGVQVASANMVGATKAGKGQTRYFITDLDDDARNDTLLASNTGAFKQIKEPRPTVVRNPFPRDPILVAPPRGNSGFGAGHNGGLPPMPGTEVAAPSAQERVAAVEIPKVEYKLVGVFAGQDPLAVFSLASGNSDQLLYRKVGEKIEDTAITAISEEGIQLERPKTPWLIGQVWRVPALGSVARVKPPTLNPYRRTAP